VRSKKKQKKLTGVQLGDRSGPRKFPGANEEGKAKSGAIGRKEKIAKKTGGWGPKSKYNSEAGSVLVLGCRKRSLRGGRTSPARQPREKSPAGEEGKGVSA